MIPFSRRRCGRICKIVTKSAKAGNYIQANGKAAMALLQHCEYTHLSDSDTKAIVHKVRNDCDSHELEKLKDLAFIQIFSAQKQLMKNINQIVGRIKSGDEDFSIRDFSDIESDQNLLRIQKDQERKFHKTSEGILKDIKNP